MVGARGRRDGLVHLLDPVSSSCASDIVEAVQSIVDSCGARLPALRTSSTLAGVFVP